MSIDIVFINAGGAHGIYGALGQTLVAVEPQMWLRLNGGYARKQGHNVTLIDAEQRKLSPEQVAEEVEQFNPRLVGLLAMGHQPSASTQSLWAAGLTAKAIKKRNPQRRIAIKGSNRLLPLIETTSSLRVC